MTLVVLPKELDNEAIKLLAGLHEQVTLQVRTSCGVTNDNFDWDHVQRMRDELVLVAVDTVRDEMRRHAIVHQVAKDRHGHSGCKNSLAVKFASTRAVAGGDIVEARDEHGARLSTGGHYFGLSPGNLCASFT